MRGRVLGVSTEAEKEGSSQWVGGSQGEARKGEEEEAALCGSGPPLPPPPEAPVA